MTSSRIKRAVLVSITYENGEVRLRLDDVESQENILATWRQREHYTSKLLHEIDFENLKFDEKDLADFGYSILARLHAFKTCGEI